MYLSPEEENLVVELLVNGDLKTFEEALEKFKPTQKALLGLSKTTHLSYDQILRDVKTIIRMEKSKNEIPPTTITELTADSWPIPKENEPTHPLAREKEMPITVTYRGQQVKGTCIGFDERTRKIKVRLDQFGGEVVTVTATKYEPGNSKSEKIKKALKPKLKQHGKKK